LTQIWVETTQHFFRVYGYSFEKIVAYVLFWLVRNALYLYLKIHFMSIHCQGCEPIPLWIKKNTCAIHVQHCTIWGQQKQMKSKGMQTPDLLDCIMVASGAHIIFHIHA